MRINLDCDGVIYNMVDVLQRRLSAVHNVDLPDPTSWNFGNWPDGVTADVQAMFEEETRQGLFRWGTPIKGALHGVQTLAKNGHYLRVVTHKLDLGSQSATAARDTVEWLRQWGLLPYVEVVFTRGFGKQGYPADVVVDDHPDLEWSQGEGTLNLLFDQPWNRDVPIKRMLEKRVARAMSWDQVAGYIEMYG